MIHAYAIEPEVAVAWTNRHSFRAVCDRFGIGTPRVLLEIPKFTSWKRKVHDAALAAGLDELDSMRLDELFMILDQARVRRPGTAFDGGLTWLENAEAEFLRHPFAAIIAMANPRGSTAVLLEPDVGASGNPLWRRATAATPARKAPALTSAVREMLENCRELHLVDPHFNTGNARHRRVLQAFMQAICSGPLGTIVDVTVHCEQKGTLAYFEEEGKQLASRIPSGARVRFRRWVQKGGGDKLHNRYLLTDIGGLIFGTGLDDGGQNETEDINLMDADQHQRRWGQYVVGNGFDLADSPADVVGE